MRKIILEKGAGKTRELIVESNSSQNYIVCMSQNEASRIQREAHDMNLPIPFPLTYEEFLRKKYYGKGINGFLIDNVDLLVQYISNEVPVNAITLRSN